MKDIKKDKVKKYFLYFMFYSVFGWIYEVFLEVFIYRWGFSDRGVLLGTYCPVYGVGALIFIILIYPIIKDKSLKEKLFFIPAVFILCALTATFVELIASYICEYFIGNWPWQTYSDYKYNYQARIALSPSIRFGIGGVIILYVFQPMLEKLTGSLSIKVLNAAFSVLGIIFMSDVFVFVASKIL